MTSAIIIKVSAALRQKLLMREGSRILLIVADLIPIGGYAFGPKPTSVDAAIYGFIANIYFLPIETPLKQFVDTHPNLIRHCTAIHQTIGCGSFGNKP